MSEILPDFDAPVYSVAKITSLVDVLRSEGVGAPMVLKGTDLTEANLTSPTTRVSLKQVIQCIHNAIELSRNPNLAFDSGSSLHVSSYGMYGFAMLCSTDFRKTMDLAMRYHQLAAPLAHIHFEERGEGAVWTITPFLERDGDARLYKFIVEMQMGLHISLHRDVMGVAFLPSGLNFTYPELKPRARFPVFDCQMHYAQAENSIVFAVNWLDQPTRLGNGITLSTVLDLCDKELDYLTAQEGLVGRVQRVYLTSSFQEANLDFVSAQLGMSERTLRRKLSLEGTSFRAVIDQLRESLAVRYLRETEMTADEVAAALGFKESSAFRHAFRRWTGTSPGDFRRGVNSTSNRLPHPLSKI